MMVQLLLKVYHHTRIIVMVSLMLIQVAAVFLFLSSWAQMRCRDQATTTACLVMRVAISVLLHDASVGVSLELLVAEQQLLELICSHSSATIIGDRIMVAILVMIILMMVMMLLLPLGTAMAAGH